MKGPGLQRAETQTGIAMVEFAIALPLLLLLLLAIGEFGRMLFQYNSLLQASRDAARFVAGQAWDATLGQIDLSVDLSDKAKDLAVYGIPDRNNPIACPDDPEAPDPCPPLLPDLEPSQVVVSPVDSEHVQVSIRYEFKPVIGSGLPALIGDAIPMNFELVATTVMRVL